MIIGTAEFVFICQQAVEKALKSYLFFQHEDLLRTHDLLQLLERCEKYDKDFTSLFNSCNILDDYYTDTRYPNVWEDNKVDDKKLATEALKLAREVVEFAAKQINN